MLAKCVVSILELNWNQLFTDAEEDITENLSSSALVVYTAACKADHFTSSKGKERL